MIEVHDLHKSFGDIKAIDGVSFTAPDGQVTGLLGPNGAGKTTTLRVLYTILKPDSGSASIDGADVIKNPIAAQRSIGALPTSKGLYPRLTARENIHYYGLLHGLEGKLLEQRIDRLAAMLEIENLIDRRTEGFSTGETMKVAIARALIHEPHNVLLDEPTNGLDVMSTRSMRAFIRRLRDDGRCVLFSSHIMQEVSALCDQIVVIASGQVVAEGSADALLRQTGKATLEDAFVSVIGSGEGLQ